MLVGFFLGGLVIHGGLQGWWIASVLGSLGEFPLMVSATVLTAFNDNAAITYLSTLVPGFTDNLKYAVVQVRLQVEALQLSQIHLILQDRRY